MIGCCDYQGDLADGDTLSGRLLECGLSDESAKRLARLFAQAAECLDRPKRSLGVFVPGRIEILGKHTDYAGGSSIVAAVERGFCLVAERRDDRRIEMVDAATGERIAFDLSPEIEPRAGHWSNYPMTVARRMARNFPDARCGLGMAFASDLPQASGMSSSSAMIVAVSLAILEANGLERSETFRREVRSLIDLAGYLATVENGCSFGSLDGDQGVGTFGGSEDHTAILTCGPGLFSQYGYCPVRFERTIPLPKGYTLAIGSSGVEAEKTGTAMAKYNAASQLATEIARRWRSETGREEPHLAAIVASESNAVERLRALIQAAGNDALTRRMEHFLTENVEILPAASDALTLSDLDLFGQLVDRSQRAAETLLGNQIPETSYLASTARERKAVAASGFGAGFGGSVWAMVESCHAKRFLADWSNVYRERFPEQIERSSFFRTDAGPGVFWIKRLS